MQPIFLDSKNSSSQPISASPDGFPPWCLKSLDEEILICQSQAAIKSRHVSSELKAGDAQYDPSPWQKQASLFSCHTLCRPAPCCKMFNCRNPIYRKEKKKTNCPTVENRLYILISFHRRERDSSGDASRTLQNAEKSGTSIHNP